MDTRIFRHISVYIYSCCITHNAEYFLKIMEYYENCTRAILSASSLT